MLKKRIIPCLDVHDGRVVKGVNFKHLRDAGDPVELALRYVDEGADELLFLDIGATQQHRKPLRQLVARIAAKTSIPFTVGGGIGCLDDAKELVESGADKISINSAAIRRPALIAEIAGVFGSQCVVLAIDTKPVDNSWMVFSHGGRTSTPLHALDWAKQGTALGAGEILLTSMHNDGTNQGFALGITAKVCAGVSVPVIASGGAGTKKDFLDVFTHTGATAALAASVFHFGDLSIPELKRFLKNKNIPIRDETKL